MEARAHTSDIFRVGHMRLMAVYESCDDNVMIAVLRNTGSNDKIVYMDVVRPEELQYT